MASFAPFAPFDGVKVGKFPVEVLPIDLQLMVKAVAESTQTDPAMAGTIVLAILASILQGHVKVEIATSFFEPVSLYAIIVAESGGRKSTVMKMLSDPFFKLKDEYDAREKSFAEEKGKLEAAITEITSKLETNPDDDNLHLMLKEKTRDFDSLSEPPKLGMVLSGDVTSEALEIEMMKNGGIGTILATEGGALETWGGRYSATNTPNLDLIINSYSGERYDSARVTRSRVCIKEPHLTLCIATQPSVLFSLLQNPKLINRGFFERMVFCFPHSMKGKRKQETPEVPPEVIDDYAKCLSRLLNSTRAVPREMTLSSDAKELACDIGIEYDVKSLDAPGWVSGYLDRHRSRILRIAACLAVANDSSATVISRGDLKNAIQIGNYYLSTAMYACMEAVDNDLTYLLEKIGCMEASFTRSALHSKVRARFPRIADLQALLLDLVEHGYIAFEEDDNTNEGGRGRPKNARIVKNPEWIES